jgi:hypothetical protein
MNNNGVALVTGGVQGLGAAEAHRPKATRPNSSDKIKGANRDAGIRPADRYHLKKGKTGPLQA